MHTFKVLFIIGPQGSGKSTWILNNSPTATLRTSLDIDHERLDHSLEAAINNSPLSPFSLDGIWIDELSVAAEWDFIKCLVAKDGIKMIVPSNIIGVEMGSITLPMPDLYIEHQTDGYPYGDLAPIIATARLNSAVSEIHIINIKKSQK
jgi:hypothetical protein